MHSHLDSHPAHLSVMIRAIRGQFILCALYETNIEFLEILSRFLRFFIL
ncbi:hypothetical protein SBDP1_720030 [Syntrophobacter sp. SbD1]|nr:hypothetical protein SBDP1_720030 [Syntrophobacter sp. SbD1]